MGSHAKCQIHRAGLLYFWWWFLLILLWFGKYAFTGVLWNSNSEPVFNAVNSWIALKVDICISKSLCLDSFFSASHMLGARLEGTKKGIFSFRGKFFIVPWKKILYLGYKLFKFYRYCSASLRVVHTLPRWNPFHRHLRIHVIACFGMPCLRTIAVVSLLSSCTLV